MSNTNNRVFDGMEYNSDISIITNNNSGGGYLEVQKGIYVNNLYSYTINTPISIANSLFNSDGSVVITSNLSSNSTSASLTVDGGILVQRDSNMNGILRINNTTNSSNTSSGSLIISGGVGIYENLNLNGLMTIYNTTSSNSSSGSMIMYGGLNIQNTTNSVNINDGGALTILGGASILGDIYSNNFYGMYINNSNGNFTNLTSENVYINNLNNTNLNNYILNSSNGNIINLTVASLHVTDSIEYNDFITNLTTANINTNLLELTTGTFGSFTGVGSVPSSNSSSATLILTNGGISVNCTVNSSSFTSGGSMTLAGGLAIGGNTYMGGFLDVNSNNIFNITSPSLNLNYTTTPSLGLVAANKWYVDNRFNTYTIGNISGDLTPGEVVIASTFGNITGYPSLTFDGSTLTLFSTLNSTSLTNGGSLQIYGGASIDMNLYIGGNLNVLGTLDMNNKNITSVAIPITSYDAANKYYVDSSIANGFTTANIYVESYSTLRDTTIIGTSPSYNSSTGSMVFLNGGLSINNTFNSSSATFGGALTVAGGVGLGSDLYINGISYFKNTTPTYNTSSGSVYIEGGLSSLNGISTNIINLYSTTQSTISNNISFFIDSIDNNFKSIDTRGNIQIYQPTTTIGDIPVNNGISYDRLSAGKSGQILTVNSTKPLNLEWKNLIYDGENINSYTDSYIRYCNLYNSERQYIYSTFQTITFNCTRRIDEPTFSYNTMGNLYLNDIGNYYLEYNIIVDNVNNINNLQSRILMNNVELGGSRSYAFNSFNSSNTNGNVLYCGVVIEVASTSGTLIQIQCNELTANGSVVIGGSLISEKIISNSPTTDNSQYFDAYDNTGGAALVYNTFTDIPLNTERVKSSIYTHSTTSSNASITLTTSGSYLVFGRTSVYNSSGSLDCNLILQYSSGGSYSPISGINSWLNMNESGSDTMYMFGMINITSGNSIKMSANVTYSNEGGTLISNGSGLVILFISNTSNGLGNNQYINATTGTGGSITLGNVYTDIPISNMITNNSLYFSDYSNSNTEILINTSATYFISFLTTTQTSSGNLSANFTVNLYNNSSYSTIDGASFNISGSSNGGDIINQSGKNSCIVYLSGGNRIKIQGINYSLLSSSINQCSLIILCIENTILPNYSGLLTYGSQWIYTYIQGPFSTTSRSAITFVSFNTYNIPAGLYKISWYYEYITHNHETIYIHIYIDGNLTSTLTEITKGGAFNIPTSGFAIKQLSTGIHNIYMQYATSRNSITVKNIFIECFLIHI